MLIHQSRARGGENLSIYQAAKLFRPSHRVWRLYDLLGSMGWVSRHVRLSVCAIAKLLLPEVEKKLVEGPSNACGP